MHEYRDRHILVSRLIFVLVVSSGAAGIVGWLYDRTPETESADSPLLREKSIISTASVPTAKTGSGNPVASGSSRPIVLDQPDPLKAFMEAHKNAKPSSDTVQQVPLSPQAIQDKFKEAVNRQQAVSANSPFSTPRVSDGTDPRK